eukprot:jgi/Mesvir1/19102/Mv12849-RA.1
MAATTESTGKKNWTKAKEMLQTGETYTGTVQGSNSGGLLMRFGSIQGFVPFSQLDPARTVGGVDKEALERIGSALATTNITVKVIEVDQENRRLIFSERAAVMADRIKRVTAGAVFQGVASGISDFGVFVDLLDDQGAQMGITGLVHVSELSWDAVQNPTDAVAVGDRFKVKVINVDKKKLQVALSRRQVLPDPLLDSLDTLMPVSSDAGAQRTGAPLPGLETIVKELLAEKGIDDVIPGRQATERRVVSQDMELWLSNVPVEGGYNLLARSGRQVQEMQVKTSLSREEMKRAVKAVTDRIL